MRFRIELGNAATRLWWREICVNWFFCVKNWKSLRVCDSQGLLLEKTINLWVCCLGFVTRRVWKLLRVCDSQGSRLWVCGSRRRVSRRRWKVYRCIASRKGFLCDSRGRWWKDFMWFERRRYIKGIRSQQRVWRWRVWIATNSIWRGGQARVCAFAANGHLNL
jgi:hypothetical protein